MLGVNLDAQLEQRLNALAEKTHCSIHHLASEALKRYIDQEEAEGNEEQEDLIRWENYLKTGHVISNEKVMEWLASWGSDDEKPCPLQ